MSILLSIRIDSPERLRNLHLVLDYYETFFVDYDVVIVEQDLERRVPARATKAANVHYHFIRSGDVHWKTRNFNYAARMAAGEWLLMADCDVFMHPAAMALAYRRVIDGENFVQPFNGVLVEIDEAFIDGELHFPGVIDELAFFPPTYQQHGNRYSHRHMRPIYGNHQYLATGGGTLCRRRAFNEIGGWNENFVSYGFEDMEFAERVAKLDAGLARVSRFNAYHLAHPRLSDSVYNEYYRSNEAEYLRVQAMDPEALRDYANRGFRAVRFSHDAPVTLAANDRRWGWERVDPKTVALPSVSVVLPVSARTAGDGRRAPREIAAYLEKHFRDYEVLVVEAGSHAFRFIGSKKYLRYVHLDSVDAGDRRAIARAALSFTRRPLAALVDVADAASIDSFFSTFDRLRAGAKPDELVPATSRLASAYVGTGPEHDQARTAT